MFQKSLGPKGRSCRRIWLRGPLPLSPWDMSLLPRVLLRFEEIHDDTPTAAVCFSCHLSVAVSIHRHPANASWESPPGRETTGELWRSDLK